MYESNKFSRVYHLRQVTPMWHFQPKEKRCCLRASEVKPKLDRFLREKGLTLKGNGNVGQKSFDYKLSFVAPDENPVLDKFKSPLFFGNTRKKNDDSRNDKQAVFYKNEIIVNIFSFNELVLNEIDKNIREFFLTTSFGTRQDKGFGCFVISDRTSDTRSDSVILEEVASYVFNVRLPKSPEDCRQENEECKLGRVFDYILYFHKMIRSGVNESEQYYKSFMSHYAKYLGETWDKPVIRYHFELFNKNDNKYKSQNLNKEKYRSSKLLFRDALGLATDQIWSISSDGKKIKARIKISGRIKTREPNNYDIVNRFKSPISYRPHFDTENDIYKVYIILDQNSLNKFIEKNASFVISRNPDKDQNGNIVKSYARLFEMKIYDKFNLENYLDYVKNYCDKVRVKGENLSGGKNVNSIIDDIFCGDRDIQFHKIAKQQKKDGE